MSLRRPELEFSYSLTRKTVSHHNKPSDAWVIHNEQVYDVTTFLSQHPGGAAVLHDKLGSDISATMDSTHDHSAFAHKLLDKYRIGGLSAASDPNLDAAGRQLVRWDRPILHQVGLLGERYHDWIHSFPTTDHTVKMFTNDFVEGLTKCPWYVPLLFWVPIIAFEWFRYIRLIGGWGNLSPVKAAAVGTVGGLCWLLFEYTLHRFVFHKRTTSYAGNIIHFLIHGHHHITPMDFDRLVFPPVPAMILAAPFWYSAPRVLGVQHGYPWLIGFALGYLVYDMTHFWIHHAVPKWGFLKMQKRRHVHHHYFKHQVNFGISNPLWDYVFGTIDEPKR